MKVFSASFFLLFFTLPLSSIYAQTTLQTESFETEGDGSRYRANYFTDFCGNADWYRRSETTTCSPSTSTDNDYLKFYASISGITGSFFIAGDDAEEAPENPLGDGEAAYVTLATIDVSSYTEIIITVAVAANDENLFEDSRAIIDGFFMQYAFDGNIATGANSTGAIPSEANLSTGSYTDAIAFIADGDSPAGSGDLEEDTNLDGTPDGSALSTTLTDYSGTFSTGGATLMSIRAMIRTDQGGEDVAYDNIRVQGQVTLPVTLNHFRGHMEGRDLHISWDTEEEIAVKGMMVEARKNGGEYNDMTWITAQGVPSTYATSISDLSPGTYQVRLRMEDFDGSRTWSPIIEVNVNMSAYWNVQQQEEQFIIQQTAAPVAGTFSITDLNGRTLVSEPVVHPTTTIPFPAGVSAGWYLYHIKDQRGGMASGKVWVK